MQSKLAVFVVLVLIPVLIVALPVDVCRSCLQRSRIDGESRAHLLVEEGEFQKCYKMSYASFNALAEKLKPYLVVDEQ
ncbi:hypothetical protein PR003_g3753 [Phytophthora rubi]|uniref:RxLR effector protein n=1 Tax=Phytophthora rubi TaxID=129364 RepID=A0A6A4G3C6_9STRA|nr:hypothetical protein PR001_g1600 [Phytophthora rubi]KAE9353671.1 hypothetical protein PR003_g3753 [Phytophthora rubi]